MANKTNQFEQHLALPPDTIEARSFDIIRRLLPETKFAENQMPIVLRIIHTTGDPGILPHINIHAMAVESGLAAIRSGKPIVVDVKMVAAGINRALASAFGCQVVCAIDAPEVAALARRNGSTRAAAAMQWLANAATRAEAGNAGEAGTAANAGIVAIGNAPTALFALLNLIDAGVCRPALIIGTPVGFVGAAEAKSELVKRDIPFVTIEGTRGGSTICAAIVNALLKMG